MSKYAAEILKRIARWSFNNDCVTADGFFGPNG